MDRNCDLKGILFVTAVVVFLIPYNVITTEHTTMVTLSKNGSVIDKTQLPTCLNVGTIKLLSYRYLCAPLGSACTTVKEKLSAAAEIIVHEMCSLKETCFMSTFPPADLSDVDRTIIELKYTCLDQFETFVDICFNTSKTDDKTIHLIYTKKNEVLYEACQCNIKGEFALRLNDIRFKTAHSDKCSKATLTVNNQTYGCDEETDGYGSVFRRSIGERLSDETVVVTSDSTNVDPEMIYISITPIESKPIQLVCRHTPITLATTTTERVSEVNQIENSTSSTGRDSTWRPPTAVIVCVVLGVTVFFLIGCLILLLRRRKQRPINRCTKEDEEKRKKLLSKETIANKSQTDESKGTVQEVLSEYDNIESNDRALHQTLRSETETRADTKNVINKASINNTPKNKTEPHNNKKNKKTVLPTGSKPTHQPMLRMTRDNEVPMPSIKEDKTQAHNTELSRPPKDSLYAQQKTNEGIDATPPMGCDENQNAGSDTWTKYLPDFLLKRF